MKYIWTHGLIPLICSLGVLMMYSGTDPVDLPHGSIVFHQGMAGYHTFRIPAVVEAADGTILAFAEARKETGRDEGHIELVMRRSADGGHTWGGLEVVWADAPNVCGNPSPVVDRRDGKIYLLCCWGLGADTERSINSRTSKSGRKVFMLTSCDNGVTWSAPGEITPMVGRDDWTWYATGPCHALQLYHEPYNGRIIVPCDHGQFNGVGSDYGSHIIYSDDRGVTWHIGAQVPGGNESTVTELSDGEIMLNMRWQSNLETPVPPTDRYRRVALSRDGGETFYRIYVDSTLVEPVCQGSLLTKCEPDGKPSQTLFFSNPASRRGRTDLTLRMSDNDGRTWDYAMLLTRLGAYSDIVALRDGRIGVLCETGFARGHESISFFTTDPQCIERQ